MPPQPSQIKALYRAYIKEGSKFPNYNIREYVKRKAREGFRADVSGEALEAAWAKGKADFEVVKRQAIVYSIYHRKQKSIMDLPFSAVMQESSAAADKALAEKR